MSQNYVGMIIGTIFTPVLIQVGEDAFLLFWDLRAGSMMGGYWEAHDDDVTCVK